MAIKTAPGSNKKAKPFPEADVGRALRQELIKGVRDDAVRTELTLPADDDELVKTSLELDSLSAVEALCTLDGILPFKVGQCVVRAGGYGSVQSALDDMLPKIKRDWEKRTGGSE